MARDLFAVILEEADEAARQRVVKAYPNAHPYTDDVYLIASSETIARNVGIRPDAHPAPVVGVVFRLGSSWSGYADPSLWEWLEKNRD